MCARVRHAFLLEKKCASTKSSMTALVGRIDFLELDAHADAAVAPRDARLRRRCPSSSRACRKRTLILAPLSSGLVVRMAMPPWLRLSVSAAAMVLPNRYCDRDAEHDARAAAAVEVVGEQVRRQRRQDVLHGAVLVDVAGDAERRELAHFVGARDRAAEDQDRQPAVVQLADRPDQLDARRRAAAADRARSDRSGRDRRARAPAAPPRS